MSWKSIGVKYDLGGTLEDARKGTDGKIGKDNLSRLKMEELQAEAKARRSWKLS